MLAGFFSILIRRGSATGWHGQEFGNLLRESGGQERLLQECEFVPDAIGSKGITGITRDEQDLDIGQQHLDRLDQRSASHARHDDIRDDHLAPALESL